MGIILRGKIYHAKIGKKWKSLKTADEGEAFRLYGIRLKSHRRGTLIDKGYEDPTWKEFKEKYASDYSTLKKTPQTIERDTYKLKLLEGRYNMAMAKDLTPSRLIDFQKWRLSEDCKKSTVNRDMGMLKQMAKWGQKRGYIPSEYDFTNIERLEENKPKMRFFTAPEIKDLKKVLEDEPLFSRLCVLMGLYTGMRIGEVLNIKWKDVDFKAKVIHIRLSSSWSPKNKEERAVPLYDELKKTLELFRKISNEAEYVITLPNGQRPKRHILYRIFKRILVKAKLKGSYHSMRHTYGSHQVLKLPLNVVQQFLGHSKITTTENYLHNLDGSMKLAQGKKPY